MAIEDSSLVQAGHFLMVVQENSRSVAPRSVPEYALDQETGPSKLLVPGTLIGTYERCDSADMAGAKQLVH